jgi:anti-sigma regulatory factor (Ser/Thr protein kinase)
MPDNKDSIENLLQEGSTEIVRGHLKKIVEIYDLEWRVAHELVQNAVDAVQSEHSNGGTGSVSVVFDIPNDEVQVKDNGTGFEKNHDLLRPGGTGEEKRLASRSPAKGYQGVGLKAVMYSTEYFEIESRTDQQEWTFISEGLCNYVDEEDPEVPEYAEQVTEHDGEEHTYTSIKAKFEDGTLNQFMEGLNRFLREDSIRWTALYEKEKDDLGREPYEHYISHLIEWYFRSQSYVGCVNSLLDVKVKNPETDEYVSMVECDISIDIEWDDDTEIGGRIGNWMERYPGSNVSINVPYKSWDYAEIESRNKEKPTKYHITPNVISYKPSDEVWDDVKDNLMDNFLDLKLTPNRDADNFREKYEDIISILERDYSSVDASDFKDTIEKITGIYLAIGRTSYFERMGISNHGFRIISSNGTPTAHDLNVRSTSSTWYLETMHFVVNVDSNLNVGKRHLSNTRLVGKIRDFFEACYPKLVSISKRLVKRDSDDTPGVPMPDVVPNRKISREGISFTRFPEDESSLVGLFSETISRLFPDFSTYGLFRSAVYDGKFLWGNRSAASDADLNLLEFKLNIDELTNQFDHSIEEKEFGQLSLVVVWDRRCTRDGWVVKGISPEMRSNLESRGVPTSLVQYVLEDRRGRTRPLLCVSDMLQNLDKVDEENDDIDGFVEEMG